WYVVFVALVLSGAFRLIGDVRRWTRGIQKELAGRPRARIGEASGDALSVIGRAQARGDLLTAPVSGWRCLAFQFRVEQWRGGNEGGLWCPLLELQDARSFGLTDETGDAVVDADTIFLLALRFDEEGGGRFRPIDAAR